jgi:hypothetical protein
VLSIGWNSRHKFGFDLGLPMIAPCQFLHLLEREQKPYFPVMHWF